MYPVVSPVVFPGQAKCHADRVLRDAFRGVRRDTKDGHAELIGGIKVNVVEPSTAEKDELHTVRGGLGNKKKKGNREREEMSEVRYAIDQSHKNSPPNQFAKKIGN